MTPRKSRSAERLFRSSASFASKPKKERIPGYQGQVFTLLFRLAGAHRVLHFSANGNSRYVKVAHMSLRLGFYGGAGKVTGSNFLVEGARGKVIVDCGIEQGADFVEAHIYGPFPY